MKIFLAIGALFFLIMSVVCAFMGDYAQASYYVGMSVLGEIYLQQELSK